MSSGKSPELTRQLTDTESSKLTGDSPKSKCAILGATNGNFDTSIYLIENVLFVLFQGIKIKSK